MKMYNAHVEVDTRQVDVDKTMTALEGFHPAVAVSERGFVTARISLPGETLAQATAAALAVIAAATGAVPIVAEVMTEDEFMAREGWEVVPELVSVSEAAVLLGVSRQRVLQRIDDKSLPATRVGRDYVIPRAAVVAGAESRQHQHPSGES